MAPFLNTLTRPIRERFINKYTQFSLKTEKLSAANQNRALKSPKFRQAIRIENNLTQNYPRALGFGGRPFSPLGFSRLAKAYLNA